jgi:hypothetical protein
LKLISKICSQTKKKLTRHLVNITINYIYTMQQHNNVSIVEEIEVSP